ncbi:MAG: hypothetical protein QN229_06085 [Desulfurococcaceae archaeon TW002]
MSENPEISIIEWRSSLEKLGEVLVSMLNEMRLEELASSLSKRIKSASELLGSERFKALIIKNEHASAFITTSTEDIKKFVSVRTQTGLIRIPVYLRDFYLTQVGPYGIKCTCEDALMTSAKADNVLVSIARSLEANFSNIKPLPISSRYIICKHTLALASLLNSLGIVRLDDNRFVKVLKLSILVLALREGLITQKLLKESDNLTSLLNELMRSED